MFKSNFYKIILTIMCIPLLLGMIRENVNAYVTVGKTQCHTEISSSRLTFTSYAKPSSSSEGTYKVTSTGKYTTSFGTTSKNYTASGTSGAYISNQGLPSGGTAWNSVTSYYYLNNNQVYTQTVS